MLKFQESRLDKDLLPYLGIFEEEGLITFSWSNTIDPDKILLSLHFKALPVMKSIARTDIILWL